MYICEMPLTVSSYWRSLIWLVEGANFSAYFMTLSGKGSPCISARCL